MRLGFAAGLSLAALLAVPAVVQAQSIDELFRQGNAAQAAGDYATAERIFRQVLRQDPNNANAYRRLGLALNDQGLLEEAEAAHREALRLDPNYALAYNGLGITLYYQGRYEEAEAAYREALRLDPDYASAYNNLGALLGEQGQFEEAERVLRTALRLDPSDVITQNNLGNVLAEQGRLEEAEAAYREALRLDPEYAWAHNGLGNALWLLDRPGEAEAAYREALRLDPDFAFAYSNLGYLYQSQGRYDEAIALYEQALAIDPNDVLVQNNLAEARRLLLLQTNPLPSRQDDLAWLPENEPLLPLLRSVVRVVTPTPTGIQYGTGWVVKREGNRIWVLTNRHVVTNTGEQPGPLATDIAVDFFSEPPTGRTWLRLEAKIVAATGPQDDIDLTLLVIENAPDDIQPISLGDSNQLSRRSALTVIGHPITDLPWTVDDGLLSNRDAERLQISQASFGPRSSGGPILNDQNQVVGMVFQAIDTRATGTSAGFGLAYRIESIQPLLEDWGML
jgi:Flp pilus assembly protein TadD